MQEILGMSLDLVGLMVTLVILCVSITLFFSHARNSIREMLAEYRHEANAALIERDKVFTEALSQVTERLHQSLMIEKQLAAQIDRITESRIEADRRNGEEHARLMALIETWIRKN